MKIQWVTVAVGAALMCGCAGNQSRQSEKSAEATAVVAEQPVMNQLTDQERADGWELLFDGQTTQGWRGAHMDRFPDHGWVVKDGELIVLASDGSESTNGGDIVTEGVYSAFEFSVDFKITEGANSGIMYFVTVKE